MSERWLVVQLAVNRWRSAVEFPWNQTRVPLASHPHVKHIICSHTMSAADIQLSDRWAWSRYSPVIQTTLAPRRLEGQTPLLLLPPQTSQGETIYGRKKEITFQTLILPHFGVLLSHFSLLRYIPFGWVIRH